MMDHSRWTEFKEQVKAATDLVALVGETLSLKKSGTSEYAMGAKKRGMPLIGWSSGRDADLQDLFQIRLSGACISREATKPFWPSIQVVDQEGGETPSPGLRAFREIEAAKQAGRGLLLEPRGCRGGLWAW